MRPVPSLGSNILFVDEIYPESALTWLIRPVLLAQSCWIMGKNECGVPGANIFHGYLRPVERGSTGRDNGKRYARRRQ